MAQLVDPYGRPIGGKPVLDEVASSAKDDPFGSFVGELLPQRNPLLEGLPVTRRELAPLARDWQVASTFQQRRRALVSREWQIDAGGTDQASQKAADWLRETVGGLAWDDTLDKMSWGIFWGNGVGELMYGRDGRYVTLEDIRVRDSGRFRWDRGFGLRLITPTRPMGEPMPPRKFWTFVSGAQHHDDPFGVGLCHYVYWPVAFKRVGLKSALIYLEKFAHPTPIGKYQPGTEKPEQHKLLQSLLAMTTAGAIVVPDGMTVDKFEGGRSGQAGYGEWEDRMDRAISKVVLSQTMTTDAASTGLGSTQGEVQKDVAEWVVKGDGDLLYGSFNSGTPYSEGPLQWLTEWNFPGAKPPKMWAVFEDQEDLSKVAERDARVSTAGYRRTQKSMDEVYGEVYEAVQPPAATPGRVADFAEPPAAGDTRSVRARQLAHRADPVVARWTESAGDLLARSASLSDFAERLSELFPELAPDELAGLIGQAASATHLSGLTEARNGDR